jgi:hypothetical protein
MKHYSNSALSKRVDCGQQFKYKYIDQMHEKTKESFIAGGMVDAAVNAIHSNYMNVNMPKVSPENVMSKYVADEKSLFEQELKPEEWDSIKDLSFRIIDQDLFGQFEEFINYEPVTIQPKINIKIHGLSLPIIGYPDLIAKRELPAFQKEGEEWLIFDAKTAGQKPSKPSHGYRQQLATYAMGLMWQKGLKNIPQAELMILVKTKKPYWLRMPVNLTADDLHLAIEAYREHEHAIQARWYPLNRGSRYCSEKNCGFWEQCHADHGSDLESVMSQVSYAS